METKELRFALLKGCVWDASISRVNEAETNVIMERAADRLSEQQQVIDELVGYAQHRWNCRMNGGFECNCGMDYVLSQAKAHTKGS